MEVGRVTAGRFCDLSSPASRTLAALLGPGPGRGRLCHLAVGPQEPREDRPCSRTLRRAVVVVLCLVGQSARPPRGGEHTGALERNWHLLAVAPWPICRVRELLRFPGPKLCRALVGAGSRARFGPRLPLSPQASPLCVMGTKQTCLPGLQSRGKRASARPAASNAGPHRALAQPCFRTQL